LVMLLNFIFSISVEFVLNVHCTVDVKIMSCPQSFILGPE